MRHHGWDSAGSASTQVMAMYRTHLLERPELLELLPDLRGRTPACWCAPEPCHRERRPT
ncbi:DUF4326 domain-containing protein [Streptomyces sp. NPDC050534]|uniref:DUF4326 domain-containing protein n=1 Tax=Streptomyces sp. NPDC050534 TaxID=3365625 RepID=UPI0037A072C5